MSRSTVFPHYPFALAAALLLTGIASPQAQSQSSPAASKNEIKLPELHVFDPSLIDASVDPCDNFYQFSCKGWLAKHPLPPDQSSYGRFTELEDLNRLHLRAILEDAASSTG